MRVEQRYLKRSGECYYSFVYWDGEKRVRLKKSEHPHFENREDAEAWAKSKEAEFASAKARAKKRVEWKTKYYDLSILADEYLRHCRKFQQKNTWKNTKIYLEYYVFPFFVDVQNSNNPNNWHLHFESFRVWLVDEARTIRTPQRLISYSTKNHCVRTLNTFLEYLKRNGHIDPVNVYKMTGFASHEMNMRTADDLVSKEEFQFIHNRLSEICKLTATFFETAYWTGMRFNEMFGLSIDDIFPGQLEDKVLHKAMEKHNIDYYGYIVLESQPLDKARKRLSDGHVERKPLKGKKSISEKNNRIMPIINKELYNNLLKLLLKQRENYKKKKYGSNPKDYLLFDDISHTKLTLNLRAAYKKSSYKAKGYHNCRHTRCTELVGQTGEFVVAQIWLGHARLETTQRYTHIYQQSVRAARKKSRTFEFIT